MSTPFTPNNPCPICTGHRALPHGQGIRCWGFRGDDERYAHCTREEYSGSLPFESESRTYAHFLEGDCRCGQVHGGGPRYAPQPSRRRAAPPPPPKARQITDRIETTYAYTDAEGRFLFGVDRMRGKRGFLAWHARPGFADGAYGLGGAQPVPYHLPALLEAVASGGTIYVAEGEKDVQNVELAGAAATTNPGGAGKWRVEFSRYFGGADVVVVRDRDDAGRAHAAQVIGALRGVVGRLRLVEAREGKDASDHLAAGFTLAALVECPMPEADEHPEQERYVMRAR